MQRRHFLQIAAAGGLVVAAPTIASRRAQAEGPYTGPLLISVNAPGGWDPTNLCDPKGGEKDNKKTINQRFSASEIGSAGGFRYAPHATVAETDGGTAEMYSHKAFFEAYQNRLTVLNGVDTQTNNHETGSRTTWSGGSGENRASLGAMLAATAVQGGGTLPLAYLSAGGYDATGGLVSLTRANDIDTMKRIAYPDSGDINKLVDSRYHNDTAWGRLNVARQARLDRQIQGASLPVHKAALGTLFAARNASPEVQRLFESSELAGDFKLFTRDTLPGPDGTPGYLKQFKNPGAFDNVVRFAAQAQIALLAFKSGVAAAANLSIGGFDTHDDHDNRHIPQLVNLLRGLDLLWMQAAAWGVADRLVVVVGSDFGRTPLYNEGNGKDHWNITSMMVMATPAGASSRGITTLGKTVGATTAEFKAEPIDPTTGAALVGASSETNTTRIVPAMVHRELRKVLGIAEFGPDFGLEGGIAPPLLTG
jgi:uncharacterized protein (DUF1501 family)